MPLVVIGLLVGMALTIFLSPAIGVPLLLIAIVIGGVLGKEQLGRQRRVNQMRRFRRDARTRKVEFSETDRRTMV